MPAANENQEPRKQKPNGVDIGTLIILTLTLIVVGIYTYEAHRQNVLTQEAIEYETRPYLIIRVKPETFSIENHHPEGRVIGMNFSVENVGKLPAVMMVWASAAWNTRHRQNNITLPQANIPVGNGLLFPHEPKDSFRVFDRQPLSNGDLVDAKENTGGFQVKIVAQYGPGYKYKACISYYSEVHLGEDRQTLLLGEESPSNQCDEEAQ